MGLMLNPFTGNRYAYGAGNPITMIEIDGHIVCQKPDGYDCGMTSGGPVDNWQPYMTITDNGVGYREDSGNLIVSLPGKGDYAVPDGAPDAGELIAGLDEWMPILYEDDYKYRTAPEMLNEVCQQKDVNFCSGDFSMRLEGDAWAIEQGREPQGKKLSEQSLQDLVLETAFGALGGGKGLRLGGQSGWANPKSLARHYRDHGADFGATSADDYAERLLDSSCVGLLTVCLQRLTRMGQSEYLTPVPTPLGHTPLAG